MIWSYTKFNSKEEAKAFVLSSTFENHLSSLNSAAHSLIEQGLDEGSYCEQEASRLRELRDYFSGVPPRPGYVWEYSTHGLHSVYQAIDMSNITKRHPVFLEYIAGQSITKREENEAYNIWKKAVTQGGINNLFKMTYHFRMKNLIPDNIKLLKIVREKY